MVGSLIELTKYTNKLEQENRSSLASYQGFAIITKKCENCDDSGIPLYTIYMQNTGEYHVFSTYWFSYVIAGDL